MSPQILLEMAELNAIRYLDVRVKSHDQAVSAACFHCLAYLMNFDKQFVALALRAFVALPIK